MNYTLAAILPPKYKKNSKLRKGPTAKNIKIGLLQKTKKPYFTRPTDKPAKPLICYI